ncbi:MAG: phosphate regulon transcriptional regulator PhoB [Rhodomicrobiaceae bacterium]|jgi:two-component system phosphate regulon response regulator PhoB|nr:MAG: DNA-binding response regulator [Methyloligella sp.]
MNANILVVEDEEPLALLLQYNLEAEGFNVNIIDHGDDVELAVLETAPNLIIMDWMLPGVSGLELCRRVRSNAKTCNIPIILLTARGEETDRIRGLTTGADDYVTKPFSVPELVARVKAVLRRANPESIADVLTVGDVELDRSAYKVNRGPREVRLGPTEFRLLEFLMESPGRVYSRSQLLDSVWGQNVYVDERTVDVHIGRLRKALNRGKEQDPIRTVRGAGYSISDQSEKVQERA